MEGILRPAPTVVGSERRMVESEGIAPSSTCLQGRCITCLPRPRENGRPPRCCPERAEFWRLCCASWRAACGNWPAIRSSDPDARLRPPSPRLRRTSFALTQRSVGSERRMVRLPGVAPGHPPWRGGILAVKSQPRKLKGPEASLLPAHAISTKNKHLLVIYSIPARGFTAAVSVFRGTPPPKPLKCKSVSNHPGARLRWRWAEPTGEEFVLLCAIFSFATADIIETSLVYRSQTVHLSLPSFTIRSRETKNPAYTR